MATEDIASQVMKPENENKATVDALYKALASVEKEKVAGPLASDLEWWFHGPQNCQHMMRLLTGDSTHATDQFKFEPRSITAIDDRVIAEGWEGAQAYWVHVWTLKDGLITQFREYFNTLLTVTELRPMNEENWEVMECHNSPTLWQSRPRSRYMVH
ncbi:hypothetical protein F0562_017782 [Nyssa sinensis]|uniref:Wound-induced protein 1 n=1 Tax=Nyssa sinensis TaxID=561372 RepID=A0A5J4ZHD7_9ASTE|nr:hypothetical protein F0562_017782 [Nyssa sinensis]